MTKPKFKLPTKPKLFPTPDLQLLECWFEALSKGEKRFIFDRKDPAVALRYRLHLARRQDRTLFHLKYTHTEKYLLQRLIVQIERAGRIMRPAGLEIAYELGFDLVIRTDPVFLALNGPSVLSDEEVSDAWDDCQDRIKTLEARKFNVDMLQNLSADTLIPSVPRTAVPAVPARTPEQLAQIKASEDAFTAEIMSRPVRKEPISREYLHQHPYFIERVRHYKTLLKKFPASDLYTIVLGQTARHIRPDGVPANETVPVPPEIQAEIDEAAGEAGEAG